MTDSYQDFPPPAWRSAALSAIKRASDSDDDWETAGTRNAKKRGLTDDDKPTPPPLPLRKKHIATDELELALSNENNREIVDAARVVASRIKDCDVDQTEETKRILDMIKASALSDQTCMLPDSLGGRLPFRQIEESAIPAKRLEDATAALKECVGLFKDAREYHEGHEYRMTQAVIKFEKCTKLAAEKKHAASEYYQTVVKRHREIVEKMNSLDSEFEGFITASRRAPSASSPVPAGSNRHLSLALDAMLSGDARVSSVLNDRKRMGEMENVARDETNVRLKELSFHNAVCLLCESGGARLEGQIEESRKDVLELRRDVDEVVTEEIKRLLPSLVSALVDFAKFQAQRETSVTEKLVRLRAELNEHSALFSLDEAPTERADLERRLGEFEHVIKKSEKAIKSAIDTQISIWTDADVPNHVAALVQSRLGKLVENLPLLDFETKKSFFTAYANRMIAKSEAAAVAVKGNAIFTAHAAAAATNNWADEFSDQDGFFDDASSSSGSLSDGGTQTMVILPVAQEIAQGENVQMVAQEVVRVVQVAVPRIEMPSPDDIDDEAAFIAAMREQQRQIQRAKDSEGSGCVVM